MITINISKAVNKYADLFEYQKDEKSESPKFKEGYWSFKTNGKVIDHENKDYVAISEILRNSDLDEDSAYTFTVEALEAMKTIIIDTDCPQGEEREALADYGNIQPYSEALIYTSEVISWFAKGNNWALLDLYVQDSGIEIEEDKFNSVELIRCAYTQAWEEHYFKLLELVLA